MKLIFQNNDLKIYNSIFEYIDANMYIIIEKENALIIDPHKNNEVYNLLLDKKVKNITICLTHEHPDHVSGIKWLKDNFNVKLISTKETSDYISNKKNTRPILITFVLEERDKENGTNYLNKFNSEYEPFTVTSDVIFDEEFSYKWNNHKLQFKSLQGHSKGSCFIFLDEKIVFTGDTLLKDYPVITRFPRGGTKIYKNQTIPYIESLNQKLIVLPGHGRLFELRELFKENKLNIEIK